MMVWQRWTKLRVDAMAKKTAKKTTKKAAMPRREDIQGIVPDLPDISDWREAARVLKIRPFYQGPGALPFSCLTATQMRMDPPKKVGRVSFSSVNDFRLAEQCLQRARLHSYE
jgi:hypothetical protein